MKLQLREVIINEKVSILEKYNTVVRQKDRNGFDLPDLARYEYYIRVIMPNGKIHIDYCFGTDFQFEDIEGLYTSGYFQIFIDRMFNWDFMEDVWQQFMT